VQSVYPSLKCSKASRMKTLAMLKHAAILISYQTCCVRWKFAYFLLHKATQRNAYFYNYCCYSRN